MNNASERGHTSRKEQAILGRSPRLKGETAAWVAWAGLAWLAVAGCASPPQRPLECLGPWAVGCRRAIAVDPARRDRTLPLAIWYPVEPDQATGRRASYTFYRRWPLTLRLRSDVAVADAPVSRARKWPLIVFSHGAPTLETQSPNYVETLASWGFVVVGVRHVGSSIFDRRTPLQSPAPGVGTVTDGGKSFDAYDVAVAAKRGERWALDLASRPENHSLNRPFDVWFTINWVAEQGEAPSSFLHDAVDATRVGVTGHSAGGSTALAAAASYGDVPPDPRIRAIVAISAAVAGVIPDKVLRTVAAPTLFVVGDRDERAPWEAETLRAAKLIASQPAAIVKVRGAGHCQFADIEGFAYRLRTLGLYPWTWSWLGGRVLSRAYRECHKEGMLAPCTAQRLLDKYAVAFFRLHLQGDRTVADTLSPARARRDEPAVELLTPPFPDPARVSK